MSEKPHNSGYDTSHNPNLPPSGGLDDTGRGRMSGSLDQSSFSGELPSDPDPRTEPAYYGPPAYGAPAPGTGEYSTYGSTTVSHEKSERSDSGATAGQEEINASLAGEGGPQTDTFEQGVRSLGHYLEHNSLLALDPQTRRAAKDAARYLQPIPGKPGMYQFVDNSGKLRTMEGPEVDSLKRAVDTAEANAHAHNQAVLTHSHNRIQAQTAATEAMEAADRAETAQQEAYLRQLQIANEEADFKRRLAEQQALDRAAAEAQPLTAEERATRSQEVTQDIIDRVTGGEFTIEDLERAKKTIPSELTKHDAHRLHEFVIHWGRRNPATYELKKDHDAYARRSAVMGLAKVGWDQTKEAAIDRHRFQHHLASADRTKTRYHEIEDEERANDSRHRELADLPGAEEAAHAIHYPTQESPGMVALYNYMENTYGSIHAGEEMSDTERALAQTRLLQEINTDSRALWALLRSGLVTNGGVDRAIRSYLKRNTFLLESHTRETRNRAAGIEAEGLKGPESMWRHVVNAAHSEEDRELYNEIYRNAHWADGFRIPGRRTGALPVDGDRELITAPAPSILPPGEYFHPENPSDPLRAVLQYLAHPENRGNALAEGQPGARIDDLIAIAEEGGKHILENPTVYNDTVEALRSWNYSEADIRTFMTELERRRRGDLPLVSQKGDRTDRLVDKAQREALARQARPDSVAAGVLQAAGVDTRRGRAGGTNPVPVVSAPPKPPRPPRQKKKNT